ncbi:MAG: polysaccharide biosynthesis protein [Anaeromyxobacter sp.]|nr:polysaccharide biosynthesis protein [Anaeromyxobacter sp.]
MIAVHLALWAASYWLAFGLRFDFSAEHQYAAEMLRWFPILLVLRLGIYQASGLFRGMWKYTGARDLKAIVLATSASTLLFLAVLGLLFRTFPRSVITIEWALCIILVGGARFTYRTFTADRRPAPEKDVKPTRLLIVGAGDAGELLLRELHRNHAARFHVVGFADDDHHKLHAHIHGVRVVGTVAQLPALVGDHDADEVIIAAPTATGAQMRRIVELCKASGARFKTMPGLDQLIDGRVTLNQLRNVAIEDLLGRDPVELDMEAIAAVMKGHVVMVTGAGGSIGSELCRQVCRFAPSALLLVERTENNLFQIHRELAASHPEVSLVALVADVGDAARMAEVFERHRPSVVLHAAAHKHVPMMEWNPGEAVKNNVLGTRCLADLADRFGVERFVMISTDKAVNPTSVMGATKRVAELYVQSLSQRSRTKFVTVRFGNVLGSAGSVIPIFKEQIAAGGPVLVTHPEMKRYFMTIPEASQLVLQAGTMGHGGEIFILDMGEPVRIADLARDLITLSGLTPGVDVEIRFSGVRPGEKLFEELSVDAEAAEKTRHPKIFVGRLRPCEQAQLERGLERLREVLGRPAEEVRARLAELVPEYASPEDGARAASLAREAAEQAKPAGPGQAGAALPG